jgi:hypothetical protein
VDEIVEYSLQWLLEIGPFCFEVAGNERFTFNFYFTIYFKNYGRIGGQFRIRIGAAVIFRNIPNNSPVNQISFYYLVRWPDCYMGSAINKIARFMALNSSRLLGRINLDL